MMTNCTIAQDKLLEIVNILSDLQQDTTKTLNNIEQLHKKYSQEKDYELCAVYLSFIALGKYLSSGKYIDILNIIK